MITLEQITNGYLVTDENENKMCFKTIKELAEWIETVYGDDK